MLNFIKENKEELKKPFLYIMIGLIVFYMGYVGGKLDSFSTVILGMGCLVFGVRDILILIFKDYEW